MGGERATDFIRQDIAREGVNIAQLLDSEQVQQANERLRRASFDMSPEDFHKLVTVIDDTEQPQTGADLILDSPDLNRQNLNPGYRDNQFGANQNQSGYRHGRNGRYMDEATLVSVVAPDGTGRGSNNFWKADIALMRTAVDPLQASPYIERASNLRPSIHSGDQARDTGVQMADLLDRGYPEEVVEHLRQESFGNNSPEFMQKVIVADGIENKNTGADLQLRKVLDTGENYFNQRDRRQGQNQNDSRYRGGRNSNSYPISETVVSIIQPNTFDGSGATSFLRSDIAIMRSSIQPLDAVFRPMDSVPRKD